MEKPKMMHIAITAEDIGQYCFLPGSPERALKISKYFDDVEKVGQNREHTTYSGYLEGIKVSVTSTGMGGPSSAICMEELVKIGGKKFIRIGTCASTAERAHIGDIIIPQGTVRMEGTALHYLPMEYPAVPDYEIMKKIEEAALKLKYHYHVGVTITKDSFYTQTEPETKPIGYELINRWNAYEKGGAIATSMEEATLFIVGSSLQVQVASVLGCATNYKRYKEQGEENKGIDFEKMAIETGIEAMRQIILADKAR